MNEIEIRFTHHVPKSDQPERFERIRSAARGLAELIDQSCPESVEKDTALSRLDESVMWANAAIARRED